MAEVQVRWMIRRDLASVLNIEFVAAAGRIWTEEDFIDFLRQRNCIGMVATDGCSDDVLAYMVYELHKEKLVCVKIETAPGPRAEEAMGALVRRLKDKLSMQRRKSVSFAIGERDLFAQVALRGLDVPCVGIEGEDYIFRYDLKPEDDIYSPYAPANRISEYCD